jgi:hypothetical protein
MVLMPAGVILDLFVYPERVREFFQLRLICSVLAGAWWTLHQTTFGERHYRLLGVPIVILPGFIYLLDDLRNRTSCVPLLCRTHSRAPCRHCHRALDYGRVFARSGGSVFFILLACARWPIGEEQGIFFNIYFLVQADTSAERKKQGLAIGLALVRELGEIQGGQVSVTTESAPCFTSTTRKWL